MTINFCKEMGCPFGGEVSGCTKHITAARCPVIYEAPGKIRAGVECVPGGNAPWSQRCIELNDDAELSGFIAAYNEFINSPEIQERLEEDRLLSGDAGMQP